MPFAELGAVRLHYVDEGTGGPPLLLVPGWTCDIDDWLWQLPALSARHRVVVLDLRGHGRSSVPDEGYRVDDHLGDVLGLIEALGLRDLVAVGHSLGAYLVTLLAVEHPELLRGIVAVDPTYGDDAERAAWVLELARSLRDAPTLESALGALASLEASATPVPLVAWHARRAASLPRHVLAETLVGLYEGTHSMPPLPEIEDLLRRRSVPALSFHRRQERAAWEATLLHDEHSHAIGWEGSGHWLHQERPEELNALLLAWVDGLPG